MSKKVLILSGSPRKGGNSDILCDQFMRGAEEAAEPTLACFRGYADCLEGSREKGIIYGTGAYQPGEIKESPAFKEAYEMGRSV